MYYKVARLPIGYAPPPERDSVVTVPDRNRRLLATDIAAFDSLESDAKDSDTYTPDDGLAPERGRNVSRHFWVASAGMCIHIA